MNDENAMHDDTSDSAMVDYSAPYYEYAPSKPIADQGANNRNAHHPGWATSQDQEIFPSMTPPDVNQVPLPSAASSMRNQQPFPPTPPSGPNQQPFPLATSPVQHQQSFSPVMPVNNWQPKPRSRRKLMYSIAAIAGVVLIVLVASSALLLSYRNSQAGAEKEKSLSAQATANAGYQAVFHSTACPFKPATGIVDGQGVSCGFLTVPEDRSRPRGRTIQLAVAIFRTSNTSVPSSSTPDLYLTGGPGGDLLSSWGAYVSTNNLSDLTLGHDLIMFDQRGTGYSKPALNCQEFANLSSSTENQNLTAEQGKALYVQAGQQCHDRLVKAGIDLRAYTTIANATDVHDLISALHYKQVNLYGVSYGTRLALTVMHLFPNDIRSVVLDSTLPTQNNLFTSLPAVTQHAIDVLFQGCAAYPHCNTTYPQLQSVFYKLVTDLNANPVTFQDVKYGAVLLNGDGLVNWLFSALYVTEFIPMLPEIIMQIRQGDYKLIAQFYGELVFRSDISYGMYYSVECGEDMAFTTQQALTQSATVLHQEIRSGILSGMQSDFSVCQIWGQQRVPTSQKQPVVSSIPTLILSGEYDPITPTSNARLVEQTLSKSYLFLFPATGHGVFYTGSCPDTIMIDFLNNPTVKPNGSCIASMTEPNFQ